MLKVTTNPAKGEYTIDPSTGEIKFNDYLEGEQIYVNYKRPEVVDVMAIGSRDFPLTVSVVHDGHFEQMDGSIQGYQVELKDPPNRGFLRVTSPPLTSWRSSNTHTKPSGSIDDDATG